MSKEVLTKTAEDKYIPYCNWRNYTGNRQLTNIETLIRKLCLIQNKINLGLLTSSVNSLFSCIKRLLRNSNVYNKYEKLYKEKLCCIYQKIKMDKPIYMTNSYVGVTSILCVRNVPINYVKNVMIYHNRVLVFKFLVFSWFVIFL